MRMGLIGYGAWGRLHARAILRAGAELGAICCRGEARARQAAAEHPGVAILDDWRELVRDPNLEAIDIVVPNHLHGEIGAGALDAGKDVLLEKPMAITREECDRLIQAATRNDRVLTIGHELRLSTQWGAVKRIIEAGEIGRPRFANFSLFRFPFRPGAEGWRHAPDKVGSWLLEEPVHFFDLLLWYFAAAGDPIAVLARGRGRAEDRGLIGNVAVWLRFPGGLHASVTQSLGGFENHFVLEIVGEDGALRTWWSGVMDRTYEPSFELKVKRKGDSAPEIRPIEISGEVFELDTQLRLVVEGFRDRRPLVTGEAARRAVIVCLAAERSLAENREIPLEF